MRKQFAALAAARLIAAGLSALALVFVARFSEVQSFGTLVTFQAFQATLLAVFSLGITPFILREYSRGNMANVCAALRLNITSSAIAGSLAAIVPLIFLRDPLFVCSVISLAIAIALDKNIESQLGISIARGSKVIPSLSVLIRALVSFLSFLLFSFLGVDPILSFCVGRLLGSICGLIQVLMTTRRPYSADQVGQFQVIGVLWPLAMSNSIASLRSLDTVIVSGVSGLSTAGLYSAASKSLAPVTIVAGALSSVLMPRSTIMSSANARALIWRISKWALGLTLLLVPMTFFSSPALEFVFGADYTNAAGAFSWILVSLPAASVAPMIATILQAQGLDRYVVVNSAVFTPLALMAAGAGAIAFGATGAGASFAVLTWLRSVGLLAGTRRLG